MVRQFLQKKIEKYHKWLFVYIQADGGANNASAGNSNENSMDGSVDKTAKDNGASRSGKAFIIFCFEKRFVNHQDQLRIFFYKEF